ncbi:unnamed protein product, partial [Rotaria sp. Silwood2]
ALVDVDGGVEVVVSDTAVIDEADVDDVEEDVNVVGFDAVVVDDMGVDDVEEDVNVVGFDAALVDVDEGGEVVVSGVVVADN